LNVSHLLASLQGSRLKLVKVLANLMELLGLQHNADSKFRRYQQKIVTCSAVRNFENPQNIFYGVETIFKVTPKRP
jgi:hypothetical protein